MSSSKEKKTSELKFAAVQDLSINRAGKSHQRKDQEKMESKKVEEDEEKESHLIINGFLVKGQKVNCPHRQSLLL
jgi:hypothetical protein